MQRKQFQQIADIIGELPPDCYGPAQIARHFADRLHRTNGGFKPERFLKACGYPDA